MKKHEQRKLSNLVRDFVDNNDGTRSRDGAAYELSLQTKAGELRISPMGDWIACRFTDVDLAKTTLGDDPSLNRHSGKWNFHYHGDFTAKLAFELFEARVRPLLEHNLSVSPPYP